MEVPKRLAHPPLMFTDIHSHHPTEPMIQLTRDRTNLFLYLCELLHTFEQHHSFRSHAFILKSDIALRVATLLKAKDKHLRHGAFASVCRCQ